MAWFWQRVSLNGMGAEVGPNCGIWNVRLRSLDVIYCKDILQEMGHQK